jgi:FADH2 O2-dependent halogenase
MDMAAAPYDIAIIGSGIGGSTLGAILARQGLNVVIFEAGSHPKFAIGESMILETSETLRAMAELYDVPELAYFSSENYFAQIGTSHGIKRHFSYLHHTEGYPQDLRRSLQAVIPRYPHGHELHLHRQDSDYFLTTVAVSYGATVLQNTPVKDIALGPDGVEIITAKGDRYAAAYVVDASGFRSILAERFTLRDHDQRAHSRTIFTHMVDVPCFNSVGASRAEYDLPFRLSEGTLHHIFKGGWLWVIPFDNHPGSTNPLCSVGLQLDPRLYPTRTDLSPEEEFYDFIERFPSIPPQFQRARAVRAWTRTERLQYSASGVVGDRYCLLGHAAGFIDPLYSKGLYTTLMSVSRLAHLLLAGHREGDYSAARFRSLETQTLGYVRANDRLVANSFKSWGNYELWSVYAVLWLLGAYLELVKLVSVRGQARDRDEYYAQLAGLHLVGGGFAAFDALAERVDTIVEDVDMNDDAAVRCAVAEIRALFAAVPWMPQAFRAVLDGKTSLPTRKIRPGLFRRDEGFLGAGDFRAHFFGTRSMAEVSAFFLRDAVKYSTPAIRLQKRLGYAHRTRAEH